MKPRKPLPPRRAYLKRSTKRIPPINLRQARRKADKYQAYLRSPEWKEKRRLVRQRSGGRCENYVLPLGRFIRAMTPGSVVKEVRCWRPAKVCNHDTYARFGHENLEDLRDLCDVCDGQYESERSYRASRRRYLATVEGKR